MPTPGDKLSSLFKSLRPDDSHLEASTHEAVREAEQRWPLFKAVQPAKSATTPLLKPEDRKNWQSPEKPAPRKRKPAASTPSMSDQLAQGLGRMTAAKPVAKRRTVVEKSLPTAKTPAPEAPVVTAPVVRRYAVLPTSRAMPDGRIATQSPPAPQAPAVESKARPAPPPAKSTRPKPLMPLRSAPPVETPQVVLQPPAEDSLLSLFSTVAAPNAETSLPAPLGAMDVNSAKSTVINEPTDVLETSMSLEKDVSSTTVVTPVEALHKIDIQTATNEPQKPPVVRAKQKKMAPIKAIERQTDMPPERVVTTTKSLKEVVNESTPVPKSDSLKSLFGRLETPEQPVKKPASKKSSFLGRLGKR